MKWSTINRIRDNSCGNRVTVIGCYTYKCNLDTGDILRARTEDFGRIWIDSDGGLHDKWEVVAHA